MSLDPSRPLPLPAICEICNWPLRSHSDLSFGRRRVSVDNWPVHGRCRESFPSLCSSSSRVPRLVVISADVAVALVSCFFSKFAESYLPLDAVVRDLPCALVVTASNGLSLDQAQEHVETLSADSIVVFEKLCDTVCSTPNSSLHTCFLRNPAQTNAQGNGVLMSAASGQRIRPQLSVYKRAVSSAPACNDHDVSALGRTNVVTVRPFAHDVHYFAKQERPFTLVATLRPFAPWLQHVHHHQVT